MSKHSINIQYEIVTFSDLEEIQQSLISHCLSGLPNAYAPYSKFKVSASLLLDDGSMINGVNIENAAYPACICAERVAISTLRSQFPHKKIKVICVAVQSERQTVTDAVAAPCGECRQVICETIQTYNYPVSVILYKNDEHITVLDDAKSLLPFAFGGEQLHTME